MMSQRAAVAITVSWHMMLCRLIGNTIYCLHLHGRLNIEAADCSETFIHIYQTVHLHILVVRHFNIEQHEDLKPQQLFVLDVLTIHLPIK